MGPDDPGQNDSLLSNRGVLANWTNTTGFTTQARMPADHVFPEVTVSNWFWRILPPIMFVVGLLGNVLTLGVLRRLGIRNSPTLVFICFLAITDCVILLVGLPHYWILYAFDIDLSTLSTYNCKLYYFFIYLSMQYSSWILVGVTTERVVKTHFVSRYRIIYTTKKVVIGLLVTLVVLILVNGHFFFTNGINDYTDGDCDSLTPEFLYFDQYVFVYIDFSILSAAPFLIMAVGNAFLVAALKRFTRRRSSMVHRSALPQANRVSVRMTKMCVICTFYFLFATAPISVYFILDSYLLPKYKDAHDEAAVARMDLAWTITYLVQFSNYCINFLIYTNVNSRFMDEFKQLIHCKPSLRQIKIYTTQSQRSSHRKVGVYGSGSSSHGIELSSSDEMQV